MRLDLSISPLACFCISAEELPFALRAAEFRVATDEATLGIKHFAADNASAELDLASLALFDQVALWHAVDDRDEFAHLAGGALTTLAERGYFVDHRRKNHASQVRKIKWDVERYTL